MVNAEINTLAAIVLANLMDGYLPCQHATANNLLTGCRRHTTGAPPLKPTPSLTGTPPVPPLPHSDNEGAQCSEIERVPPRHVYINTPFPNAQIFNRDTYPRDCKRSHDFIADVLTDSETSIG